MVSKKMLVVADPVFDYRDMRLQSQNTTISRQNEYQMRLVRSVGENWQRGGGEDPTFRRLASTGHLADKLKLSFGKNVDIL